MLRIEPLTALSMQYNVNIVKLFRPVLDRESSAGEDAPYIDRARSVISSSLREIRRLVLLHDTHHGWSNAITFVIHGITVASFGTLDEMAHNKPLVSQPAIDERHQGLVTCLRALTVLLSYSYFAQPVFRLLTQKCVTLGVGLPAEVQGALDYCTSEEWTKKAAELVSSQFIADTRSVAEDTETMRMDAVISRWRGHHAKERKRRIFELSLSSFWHLGRSRELARVFTIPHFTTLEIPSTLRKVYNLSSLHSLLPMATSI
jgi:hypothetical protein